LIGGLQVTDCRLEGLDKGNPDKANPDKANPGKGNLRVNPAPLPTPRRQTSPATTIK